MLVTKQFLFVLCSAFPYLEVFLSTLPWNSFSLTDKTPTPIYCLIWRRLLKKMICFEKSIVGRCLTNAMNNILKTIYVNDWLFFSWFSSTLCYSCPWYAILFLKISVILQVRITIWRLIFFEFFKYITTKNFLKHYYSWKRRYGSERR